MTDWRSSDDPARGGEPTYGGDYPQDPYASSPAPDPYGASPYDAAPYDAAPYDAAPYGTTPYGSSPYGSHPYGASPVGAGPYAQDPYGAHPNTQTPYPYYAQPGYGQPGYGYPAGAGYSGIDPTGGRPGTVIASAVLGYVNAGLLVIAGFYCFVGASALESLNNDFGTDNHGYSAQFVVAGIVNLVAAGLLIAGAIQMTARRPSGRPMYLVGGGLVLIATVYWIIQWITRPGLGGLSVFAILFAGLTLVGASLSFGTSGRWLAGRPPGPTH